VLRPIVLFPFHSIVILFYWFYFLVLCNLFHHLPSISTTTSRVAEHTVTRSPLRCSPTAAVSFLPHGRIPPLLTHYAIFRFTFSRWSYFGILELPFCVTLPVFVLILILCRYHWTRLPLVGSAAWVPHCPTTPLRSPPRRVPYRRFPTGVRVSQVYVVHEFCRCSCSVFSGHTLRYRLYACTRSRHTYRADSTLPAPTWSPFTVPLRYRCSAYLAGTVTYHVHAAAYRRWCHAVSACRFVVPVHPVCCVTVQIRSYRVSFCRFFTAVATFRDSALTYTINVGATTIHVVLVVLAFQPRPRYVICVSFFLGGYTAEHIPFLPLLPFVHYITRYIPVV